MTLSVAMYAWRVSPLSAFWGACMGTIASNASLLVPAAAAAAAFGGFLYSRWAQDVRRPRITQHFQGQRHVLLVVISVSHIILSLEAKLRQKWIGSFPLLRQ